MGNNRTRDDHNDQTMVERIDPLMGVVFERQYRIDFRLAAGGFGAIYRATHVETGQQFALKVLHAELAKADNRVIARFLREGETLKQLKNPNTIQSYGLGEAADGSLYIVMELLHGESLYEQFRAKGVLPWERVVNIGRQVCNSLGEAHALGIIHRDLKPANIHLEGQDGNPDFVKVLDFGIAKIIREGGDIDTSELTQAGQMIGTFDYMAPEQMVGGQCTPKTDIYTLGVVLYEMISGRRPFADAASPTAMLAALLTQTPPPLGVRGVPRDLERILMKCLEREPPNRYDDVAQLAAELDRVMAPMHEGVTRKFQTPAPVLIDAEATVVAQPRSKRGTPPQPLQSPAPERAKRGSEPPGQMGERAKRESSPPSPNVIRREGSSPKIPADPALASRAKRESQQAIPSDVPRAKRESQQAIPGDARAKRDSQVPTHNADEVTLRKPPARDSQPVPLKSPSADPQAWQSLQMPKRDPSRESQPARYDRESAPIPRDAAQPALVINPSAPVINPSAPAAYPAGSYPAAVDAYPQPAYPGYPNHTPPPQLQHPQHGSVPPTPQHMITPHPQHGSVPPTPQHMITPHAPTPQGQPLDPRIAPHAPTPQGQPLDPRVSLAAIDPNAWHNPQTRGGGGYDMAGTQSRDVLVRRIVWGLALVLGIILIVVVASRL